MTANQSHIKYAIDLERAGQITINKKSIQTNLIEEQPVGKSTNGEKLNVINYLPEFLGVLLPISLTITLGTIISLRRLYKSEHQVNDFLSYLEPVPCRNCHFFSLNPYIKCAVHPSTVLTKQAIDCLDYCPHNDNRH